MEQEKKKSNKKIFNIFAILVTLFIFVLLIGIFIYNQKTTNILILLESTLSEEQEKEVKEKVTEICNTNDIQYISKEESKKNMEEKLGTDITDNWNGVSSYSVNVKVTKLSEIKTQLLNTNGIKNVYTEKNKNNIDYTKRNETEYQTLSVDEVRNNVTQKVNNGSIYIDDIEKIVNIKFISQKEIIDNVEFYEMEIEYEKSSLNAPIGQNYKGKTFKDKYCYAYNNKTKQSFKYMFKLDEYATLKGWATKGHKDDSSYWVK